MTPDEIAKVKALAEEAKARSIRGGPPPTNVQVGNCEWPIADLGLLADAVVKLADTVDAQGKAGTSIADGCNQLIKRLLEAKQWMGHHETCSEEPCDCGLDKFLKGETDADPS